MSERIVEVDIDDLAFDGKSVGRLDGKVIFCNGGLPGERVRVEIVQSKPRYSRGKVLEIIKKVDCRIDAVCGHFDHCGGCTWQDLQYENQLGFKQNQVLQCMNRIGNLAEIEVRDCIGAPETFRYRNKMEFSFNVDGDDSFTLGLHRRGRWDEIFDLHECHIASAIDAEIVGWLRNYVANSSLSVYDVANHSGYMRFVVIREGVRTGQVMVNLVTNYGPFPEPEAVVAGLREAFPKIATIVHNQNGQKSNIATGEFEEILWGPGYIEDEIGGKRFRIRPNAFFQTNTVQAENLYEIGFNLLKPESSERILDLYCGTGSIGILLSSRVKEVVGIELVPDAIASARENAEINGIENCRFIEGDAKDLMKQLGPDERDFDSIIIDPPRAGLHPKALKRLLELAPPKLLYISCNPATFARDAELLVKSGYTLPFVQPVDMFPHTMHIELAGCFRRT